MALGVALVALLTLSLSAQRRVTLILNTGETLAVNLLELKESTIRFGQDSGERGMPLQEVAAIEFLTSTTPLQWNLLTPTRHVLILQSGTVVVGRLRAIAGRPLGVTFDTDTGSRVYPVAEIARVLLAPPRAASLTTADCAAPFVGQWTVNNNELGNIGFESAGSCQIAGWYDAAGGGTLRGTVDGQTVRFQWRAANGSQQGEAIGTIRSPKQFTGKFCVNAGCDTRAGTDFSAMRQKALQTKSQPD
jgi:hypothetical protein